MWSRRTDPGFGRRVSASSRFCPSSRRRRRCCIRRISTCSPRPPPFRPRRRSLCDDSGLRSSSRVSQVRSSSGLATRVSTVFVVLALVLGFALALGGTFLRRSPRTRRIGIAVALVAVIGSIGLSYAKVHQHRIDKEASRTQFFHVSVTDLFAKPWRPHMVNQALTTTYADLWGDWFGAFSWSVYSGEPSAAAKRLIEDQSMIGVVPTGFAIAGWLGLLWLTFRRRRRDLAVLALLPLVATIGFCSARGSPLRRTATCSRRPMRKYRAGLGVVLRGPRPHGSPRSHGLGVTGWSCSSRRSRCSSSASRCMGSVTTIRSFKAC